MHNNIDIFEEIANNIIDSDALKTRKVLKARNINEGYNGVEFSAVSESINTLTKKNLKSEIRRFMGKVPKYPETIGDHPDFDHLEVGEKEEHYIVSVFIDIKGSTKLATFLDLEEVRRIKNNILITAIQVFQALDGHIHRMQGDALFAYFGRKDMKKSDAIIDALNATTFLQYSFHEILSKRFEEAGYPKIKIRTGIDFGDDDKVLWSKYGIQNCHEITTTSIHTDLAAKLQNRAGSNKIMIGDNVRGYLDLPEEFYSKKQVQKNYEMIDEEYIMDYKGFRYRMWEFNWERYLGQFINRDRTSTHLPSKYQYHSSVDYRVRCFYKAPGMIEYREYTKNAFAIPKDAELKFELDFISHYLSNVYKGITWQVNNRGKEAEEAQEEAIFEMKDYRNKTVCHQKTAYKGHHYMKVTMRDSMGRVIAEDSFGVYIDKE